MNYFPAFFDLKQRPVLLVGGGEAAARRLRLLQKAGARVTVVAPRVGEEIAAAIDAGGIAAVRRGFVSGDVNGQAIVFAATGLPAVDERVAEAARTAGVPVNVADQAGLSSFIVPAIVERDPVVIASPPAAPHRAGQPPARGDRAAAPVAPRPSRELRRQLPHGGEGNRAERGRAPALLGPLLRRAGRRQLLAGNDRGAREKMLTLVNGRAATEPPRGGVAIVGAGPGDPDLLTLRALRLIQRAMW